MQDQPSRDASSADAVDARPASDDDRIDVVVIGASAGDLEGFTRLLRAIPPDTGMAFVVVQHLDGGHPSSLSEIVGRTTSMPVSDAAHGMPVSPNHVYVIPPNSELTINNRVLQLSPRVEAPQSANEQLITVSRDVEPRDQTLDSAQHLARSIVEHVTAPLVVLNRALTVQSVNTSFARAFELASHDIEGQSIYEIAGGAWDVPVLHEAVERLLATRRPFEGVEVTRDLPGLGTRILIVGGAQLDDLDVILLTIDDVTARLEAEGSLQRSEARRRDAEQMESVGQLAGSVAHDFNNLLTVIIGYCGLLLEATPADDKHNEQVEEIRGAAQRAAILTDQLLAFSRRKVLQLKTFDLHLLLVEFERMIRRLLGDSIKTAVRGAPDVACIQADAGEIGRVVMNLCLNARDAMSAGGTLTLGTGTRTLDADEGKRLGIRDGEYAVLTVRDTGIGMDPDMQARAFKPFVTTKEAQKGSGLGLPSVLGIVRLSGGAITCASELGVGTTFTILLPLVRPAAGPALARDDSRAGRPRSSAEVVLIVDDEEGVRGLARRILEARGYVVMDASEGHEALSVIENLDTRLDILVCDVVLPGMGGRELAARAIAIRPDLKVLFVSGYMHDGAVVGLAAGSLPFLQKPFAPPGLVRAVRDVLDKSFGDGARI